MKEKYRFFLTGLLFTSIGLSNSQALQPESIEDNNMLKGFSLINTPNVASVPATPQKDAVAETGKLGWISSTLTEYAPGFIKDCATPMAVGRLLGKVYGRNVAEYIFLTCAAPCIPFASPWNPFYQLAFNQATSLGLLYGAYVGGALGPVAYGAGKLGVSGIKTAVNYGHHKYENYKWKQATMAQDCRSSYKWEEIESDLGDFTNLTTAAVAAA